MYGFHLVFKLITIIILKDKNIKLNRKTLAYMAVHNPEGFAEVINSVK